MKIVIIGGTGLIGSKLVTHLRGHGHQAVPASGADARLGEIRFEDWLNQSPVPAVPA